jgi:two-component system, sensor histidine kinase and response regulator
MPTDADLPPAPATVMVVDDVAANLQVMASELERGGYAVVVAQGGEEAIERAALVRPDLILLDVLMPGIDGFETCRQLKSAAATRDIPVIFMTALSDTPQKLAGFDVGAVDYVTKPLDGTEVLARVRTQVALAEMRRQLADRNAQLAQEVAVRHQAEAALQRSNAELEQLAYVASHDMQEPLRMIASYLQLVEQRYQDKLDADGREFIGYAVDGAKRMQVLINDLLTYSRVGTKARPFEPVALQAVVETALTHLRIAIEESSARVDVAASLPKAHVQGDATQLVQLMQNLIANAIKFRGSASPEVRVECRDDGAAWCLQVRDNGIGIEPAYFERIFVLFQRLHGRGAYPGTGIGLALCKRIVERHGGRIWVESTPGQGSAFCFTLPHPAADGHV